jgi:predicted ABC-type ATPase
VTPDPAGSIRNVLATEPVLVFLAGPNGAGKTTFFEAHLEPLGIANVNADRLARLRREADPQASTEATDRRAFREADRLRTALVEARLSFCTETVFSDPVGAKLALLERARRRGFAVFLVFIGLESPALSVARVKQRVEQGGHDIPDDRLHARFPRTLANLRGAVPLVDEAFLFDNSASDAPYRLVAAYAGGMLMSQHPPLPPWTRGLPGLPG